ncbi:c-type cytochrome biogenesis protein CcmI [uncultured Sneathiella sp.]|uniref:c-type cytochrome biogenesis protein CcmI n=1 Tax=uncultured Sneathiella sp. TaxID=879315 RepID=UPI0030ECB2DB|tara:strand:+ start:27288 stop:28676 length:1389 start_codon:yes stop_codon:yes gene_type:complete
MIWIVISVIIAAALVILAWPFLRTDRMRRRHADQGLAVYRQQLDELETDVARETIDKSEAEAMALEIKRRMLRVDRAENEVSSSLNASKHWYIAAVLAVVIPLLSFGLYLDLGSPNEPARPLAARDLAADARALQSRDAGPLIQRLIAALKEQPDNLEGWVLLARTLSRMERYEEAAETYMKATILAPRATELFIGAGENYYFAADGNVTANAEEAFEQAFALDPENPGARYYLALRDAEAGDNAGALQKWILLYEESPADAPFMPVLEQRIERTAELTGTDIGDLFSRKSVPDMPKGPSGADIAAAADMTPEARQDMIASMVEGLASRMDETPDYEGLMRLGQAYSTLEEYEKAANAYGRARMLKPDDLTAIDAEAFSYVQMAGNNGVPPAQAVGLYRMLIEKNPEHPQALWYLGVAAAAEGNDAEAIDFWRRLQAVTEAGSRVHAAAGAAIKSLSDQNKN